MKERIINIRVSFDMSNIPEGSTITPKEKVEEMVSTEMNDLFAWDEGFNGVEVDVIDEDCDESHTYDDYDENFDPYEDGNLKFIWGVKSWDDLSGADACLYTMNDIDIIYDKEKRVYMLGVETAYLFKTPAAECEYLRDCLRAFTKYMDDNGLNKNEPYRLWMNNPCTSMTAETIEELYVGFKIFVDGFCNQDIDIDEEIQ